MVYIDVSFPMYHVVLHIFKALEIWFSSNSFIDVIYIIDYQNKKKYRTGYHRTGKHPKFLL